jgi:hypothetical protein
MFFRKSLLKSFAFYLPIATALFSLSSFAMKLNRSEMIAELHNAIFGSFIATEKAWVGPFTGKEWFKREAKIQIKKNYNEIFVNFEDGRGRKFVKTIPGSLFEKAIDKFQTHKEDNTLSESEIGVILKLESVHQKAERSGFDQNPGTYFLAFILDKPTVYKTERFFLVFKKISSGYEWDRYCYTSHIGSKTKEQSEIIGKKIKRVEEKIEILSEKIKDSHYKGNFDF